MQTMNRVSSKEFAEELLRMLESPVYSANDCRTLGRLPAKEMSVLFSQDALRELSVSDKIRTEYDHLHDEYIFYTRQEMSRVPHPRFGRPCENCGANDWKPQFTRVNEIVKLPFTINSPEKRRMAEEIKRNYKVGYKLTHYICEYCGTRRLSDELYSL